MTSSKFHNRSGFTLIELLVTIAIIALLSTLTTVAVNKARTDAKSLQAQNQVRQIANAISLLELDTALWPGPPAGPLNPYQVGCGAPNNEVWDLNENTAALTSEHNAYGGWNGPYIQVIPNDPWGNPYFFDTDFDIPPTGDGIWGAVVGSFGPNGEGRNDYDDDDIIYIITQDTCP